MVGLHWQTSRWRGKGIRCGGRGRGGQTVGPVGHWAAALFR